MSNKRFVKATLIAAVSLSTSLIPVAVQGSEKDAEYREAVMESIGGHMSAIVHIMKGEVSHKDHLGMHAVGLAELSKIANTLFPEGSESPDSHAPEFSAAVAGGDMSVIGPALNKLGDTCKACHDDYKEE